MNKTIELSDCFLKAHIDSNGWIEIFDDIGNSIQLGHYPNKRFKVIQKAIEETTKMHNPNYKIDAILGEQDE